MRLAVQQGRARQAAAAASQAGTGTVPVTCDGVMTCLFASCKFAIECPPGWYFLVYEREAVCCHSTTMVSGLLFWTACQVDGITLSLKPPSVSCGVAVHCTTVEITTAMIVLTACTT
jgi:hypothetical protein